MRRLLPCARELARARSATTAATRRLQARMSISVAAISFSSARLVSATAVTASEPRYQRIDFLASIRFASAESGSSTSARSSFRARAGGIPSFRYASASATCAAAVSSLQIEIFSAFDRLLRTAGAEVDAADQQVRLRLVRRQVNRAPQLGHRFARPASRSNSRRPRSRWNVDQLALIALRRADHRRVDAERRGRVGLRRAAARGLSGPAACRPRRAVPAPRTATTAARQFPLALRLDVAARSLQRRGEHEVGVGIAGIAPHRLAQPVDRPLVVAIEHVGVAEIEERVGVARIGVGGLGQVERRRSRSPASHRGGSGRRRGC